MNLQASVLLDFGDARYNFALRCREIENLEKITGSSISDIAARVIGFRPYYGDIKNIIILGLEGGGMSPEVAQRMFERYVDGRPLFQKDNPSCPALVAAQVMEAAWFGVPEVMEQAGNSKAAASPAEE